MKFCPYCAEAISDHSTRCELCGKELIASSSKSTNQDQEHYSSPIIDKSSEDDPTTAIHPIRANINLPENELCYFSEFSDLFEEKNITKRISYHGPTLRIKIYKGLYFRAGNLGIGKKTEKELTKIDSGILYITNKRIIFTGSWKNISIPFSKILKAFRINQGIEIVKDSGINQIFAIRNQQLFAGQLIQKFLNN